MRSIDALFVDGSGMLRGLFPPGPLIFPVAATEILALDAAVRVATTGHQIQPGAPRPWLEPLIGYLSRRLPAFERALSAEPAVVQRSLDRAAERLAALEDLGAPAVVLDAARRHARAVGAASWSVSIDLAAWIPDPAAIAATVDVDRWPTRPPVVTADISDLVLLAALCTVGPHAASVRVDDAGRGRDGHGLRWRGLGGIGEDRPGPEPGLVPDGGVVVELAVDDERVHRLQFAGAYLAVELA
ncbi:hypothetical protein ACFO1B_18555 [Dactylosporangium siamense]|uniref:Uncharacterized protein n=1 Tax=Dactylosporangium siamense TaxID=685454 RepID=A0A919PKU7_9ACTN|nr:hypothetical protein [Dactylosporangium siamense]GIG43878.1 hypothetical protein Dsi01nite_019190 [Dactylosporangium siamense]